MCIGHSRFISMDDKRRCSKCLLYHLPCNLDDNRSGQRIVPSFLQLGFSSFTEHILERIKLYLLPPECCQLIFDKLVRMHGLALENLENFRKCHFPLIHLGGYPGVRDVWMNVIASQGKFLESLDISCSNVTDHGLVLLKNCFNLKKLALNYCYQISDRGLRFMSKGIEAFTNLSNLAFLNLERCSRIHGGLIHLRGLTKLKSLNIKYCNSVTDEDMEPLSGFTSLLQLNLNQCGLSDEECQKLSELIQLKDLNLGYNKITNACLINLKGLINLESLNLDACNISSEGLLNIEGLTSLRTLELSKTRVEALSHLSGLISLRTLELSETRVEALGHLSGLHNLENLDLSFTLVNDNSLAALSTLTSLTSLNLQYLKISDEGLPFLSSHIGLTHLDLSGCKHLDIGFDKLKCFKNLQSLEICDGYLDDSCVDSIKGITSLKLLNLANNCDLTDMTLESISELTALCLLNASYNFKITDAGLQHLTPLKNLRSLYLDFTKVTADKLRRLQRNALPNLVIFQPR
ncbi:RNI-like protein [Dioscorea alata]|uniref:RNI-like protein n=1 Tax=Dioscorea alata TaxID=55571 RepID=A0ACB7WKU6_DIOAL|nr:RNI-like protein [Dioscorea alata]